MVRIVLINIYFGQLPFWFPAFLLSCRYNPDVQWLIFSDAPVPPNCPPNVTFFPMTLEAFNRLSSDKLGLNITIKPSFVYKITDLKPSFGKIVEDYITGYDFWGHCDVDIIWGHIGTFITPQILNDYDIITSRIKRISGHFCLFRNIPLVTMTYQWIPRIAAMMQDEKHYAADEEYMTRYLKTHLWPKWYIRAKHCVFAHQQPKLRVYWDRVLTTSGKYQRAITPEQCLWWKQGKIFGVHGEELMYLHFHELKKTMRYIDFGDDDAPEQFMITTSGIISQPEHLCKK